jgi:preprotein translocase subunit SecG
MAAEGIANFDSYVWLAAGFFIIGLFTAMVYEKSSSKIKHFRKQEQSQQKRQEVGSSSDIKRD